MTQTSSTTLTQPLATLLPREHVQQEAKRLSVVLRQRTVNIYALVWIRSYGQTTAG